MNAFRLTVILAAAGLAGCAPQAADLAGIARDYPRVDGSTSCLPLHSAFACTVYGVAWNWSEDQGKDVERTILPDAHAPADKVARLKTIRHTGTGTAWLNLIEGKTDLVLVAREPSTDELAAAAAKKVALDVRPVALDAFVFLAHASNPVSNLTLPQIRSVYTGQTTAWSQLGVTRDGPIHAYQRERNSGSQELMDSLVMKGVKMIEAPDMIRTTMLGPFHAIGGDRFDGKGGDPLGFSYTVYYYAAFMFVHSRVKMLAVDGIPPTSETIRLKQYPLVSPVIVGIRRDMPANSTTVKYRDWMLTPEGQKVVAGSGYVGLGRP